MQLNVFENALQTEFSFSCHFPAKLDGFGGSKERRKGLREIRNVPLLSICLASSEPSEYLILDHFRTNL